MARDKKVFALKLSAKQLPSPLIEAVCWTLDRLLGFPEFNAIYAALPECRAVDFPQMLLDALQVKVTISGARPDAIPTTGSLIIVANHPFGFLEGIALDALLLERRPDVTFMAMYAFAAIPEFRERWIFVDPERSRRKRKLNRQSLRRSFEWLARGGTLAVFPAGGMARFNWRHMRVVEQRWSSQIAAIARRTRAKILPVHFHGHNSWFFQLLGLFHQRLQNWRFIRELTNKRGHTLRVTIGRLIEPAKLAGFASDEDTTEFLRQETEKLSRL